MNELEKMRKSDPICVLVSLLLMYASGMEMSAIINTPTPIGIFLSILAGFFIFLVLIFMMMVMAGGIQRICNSLFQINDIDNKQKQKETQAKISKIETYCSLIPSIILFILGWVSFKGNIYDFVDSFGIAGEYLKVPGVIIVLVVCAVILIGIQIAKNSVEKSSVNDAKATIASILVVIISLGAAIAIFNATQRGGSFTNQYGTPTTKCVVNSCDNYIASSGDSNCCVAHSNKCLECKKYIDGDAMYCMDCLSDTLK